MIRSLFATDARPDTPASAAAAPMRGDDGLDARLIERQLAQLLHADGVLGCALVDAASGLLVAEQRSEGIDLDAAALACAQAMRAQVDAASRLGLPDVDEMTVTCGAQQHVLRTLACRPGLFLLALLDRRRANPAVARFKMAEVQRILA